MGKLLKNKTVLIGVALVLLFVGWYVFTSGSTPSTLSSTPTADAGPGDSIVRTLVSLKTITLSATVFSDPAFISLQDITTAIVPESQGRLDPFAPLTPAVAPTPKTTSGAAIFKSKK